MTAIKTEQPAAPVSGKKTGSLEFLLFMGIWTAAIVIAPFGMRALTWMFPLSALVLLPGIIRDRDYLQTFARPAMTLGGLLVFYGLMSALWAADPGRAVSKAGTILLYLLSGLIILNRLERADRQDIERLLKIMTLAFLAVCIAMILFRLFDYHPALRMRGVYSVQNSEAGLFIYNRTISFLVLVGWGLTMFWALRYPRVAAVLPVTVAIIAFSYHGISNQLSLIAGLAALAIASIVRKRFLIVLTGLTLLGLLAAPWIVQMIDGETARGLLDKTRASALHRLDIWVFASGKVFEEFFAGWGLGGSRTIPGAKTIIGSYMREQLPSHPHNAAIQVWLELGLIGVLLVSALIVRATIRLRYLAQLTRNRLANRFVATYALSALVVALLGYGLFQTVWMATLCFSLCVLIAALRASQEGRG